MTTRTSPCKNTATTPKRKSPRKDSLETQLTQHSPPGYDDDATSRRRSPRLSPNKQSRDNSQSTAMLSDDESGNKENGKVLFDPSKQRNEDESGNKEKVLYNPSKHNDSSDDPGSNAGRVLFESETAKDNSANLKKITAKKSTTNKNKSTGNVNAGKRKKRSEDQENC